MAASNVFAISNEATVLSPKVEPRFAMCDAIYVFDG